MVSRKERERIMEKYDVKGVSGGEFGEGFFMAIQHMERWIKKKKLSQRTGENKR